MDAPQSGDPRQPVEYWSQLSENSEKSGDYLGACDAALLGLEQRPGARELQYRAILNLSRAGANKRARQLWLEYRLQPELESSTEDHFEEKVAALGARLDREEAYAADLAHRSARLGAAAGHYESIYLRTGSVFVGINAAVLNEVSGKADRAKSIAAQVAAEIAKSQPLSQEDAYQLAADRAAASLLLNDLPEAQRAIEHAAALATNAAAIASTRRQLVQLCDHKAIERAIVAPLRNRNVIHYTGHMISPEGVLGRFSAEAETRVADVIRRELGAYDVGYGYGSLACGADTIIAEALLERNAEVDVVLPFGTETFVRESVANGGVDWLERFNKCLKQVRVIHATEGEYVGDAQVFAYASRLAMGLAILRAQQLCAQAIQLAVWDGQKTAQIAGSWADISEWNSRGRTTITVPCESEFAGDQRETRVHQPHVRPLPPRTIRAIMFGDFHGFSRLSDRQMLVFFDKVMAAVADVLGSYDGAIATRNSWGDGIFVVFNELGAAARCALDIQSTLAKLDLPSLGLPATLGLRLGLDAGAVFEIRDPILKSLAFAGGHINRTARLEPTTPPGEVYVTEAFAALFTLLEQQDLICEYVGMMRAPKNYGLLRSYLLRRHFAAGLG
jgi:class 3 adenylate cyclase